MKNVFNVDSQYRILLMKILNHGYEYVDKKRDVVCKQVSSHRLIIDLTEGFPALTLKKLYWKGIVGELIWFLRGDTSIKYLLDNNIHIWDKDAYNYYLQKCKELYNPDFKPLSFENFINRLEIGDLGRIYGAQWRDWTVHKVGPDDSFPIYVDQITNLIRNLKKDPMSRRHIVTAWNPAELDDMALPPCHWSFEIIPQPLSPLELAKYGKPSKLVGDKELGYQTLKHPTGYGFTLKWHQRSVDTYLGLPFNIASYGLLAYIIGKLTGMTPLRLEGDLSNVHLYENSWKAAKEVAERDPYKYPSPKLEDFSGFKLGMHEDFNMWINNKEIADFKLKGYQSYDNIPVEMLAPNV